ncbi:MAG: protein kinase domain-containing protein, partial [bacterium]
MKCFRCNAENSPDTRFCRNCATPLQTPEEPTLIRCKQCNAENPPDARFCGNCAAELYTSGGSTITFDTPVNRLNIGTKFAERYQIIEELGRGGMGTVYKALDTEVNEKIAIKLLNPEISNDERTIVRFRNELKLARKVSHQYVCRMYELMKKNGTYFITMQYVSGEDLRSTINRVGQLSVKKTLEYTRQICEGLNVAHRLGVVHRDLKPHNIMIDKDGKVRIMDFGIARSLKSTGLTDSGVMIGTPQYMSPEQASEGDVDQRSDIYSLGIIIFELLTGTIPFKGDTSVGVALKHCTDLPPNPKSLNPDIPEELNQLILRCLEKKRERRPQTVEEILTEITRIQESLSDKQPISIPMWNRIRRNIKYIIPGTIILAAMVLFIVFPILQPKLKVTINSNPPGALVYLGKKQVGSSPVINVSQYTQTGVYNFTGYFAGTQNYTASWVTRWLTVL